MKRNLENYRSLNKEYDIAVKGVILEVKVRERQRVIFKGNNRATHIVRGKSPAVNFSNGFLIEEINDESFIIIGENILSFYALLY